MFPILSVCISSIGNTWRNSLIKTDRDALVLLALDVFFQSAGCRFNFIRKLTVGEVLEAKRVPEQCMFCGEPTDHYRRHIRRCRKWKKAKQRGEESPNVSHSRAIFFHHHKTYRGEPLSIVLDQALHKILVLWIRKTGDQDTERKIFAGLRWEHLLTSLTRIVGKRLLAKASGGNPIGSKCMRQYAATVLLKKASKPHQAMRRIGGSETMARKHYADASSQLQEKLNEKQLILGSTSEEDSSETSSSLSNGSESESSAASTSSSDDEAAADNNRSHRSLKRKIAPPSSSSSSDEGGDGDFKKRRNKGKLGKGQKGKSSKKSSKHVRYSEQRELAQSSPSSSSDEGGDGNFKKGRNKGKLGKGQKGKSSKKSSKHVRYSEQRELAQSSEEGGAGISKNSSSSDDDDGDGTLATMPADVTTSGESSEELSAPPPPAESVPPAAKVATPSSHPSSAAIDTDQPGERAPPAAKVAIDTEDVDIAAGTTTPPSS